MDVVLSMPFITKAEDVIDRTGGDENGKDVRLKVVSSVSEALGIDLWLDGLHLRGRLTNASGQQDAQRALEAQVRWRLGTAVFREVSGSERESDLAALPPSTLREKVDAHDTGKLIYPLEINAFTSGQNSGRWG